MTRKLAVLLCLSLPLLSLAPRLAQAQDKNPSFTLVNKAPQPIRELFVTPSGDANWGKNRLEQGTIAPGASTAVRRRIDGNCVFDIRVVYADATREERRTVNTCAAEDIAFSGATKAAAMTPTGKPSDDPSFRLTNHNKQPIAEIYAAPPGKPKGDNLLDKGALPPDAAIVIKPARGQGCTLELRVVFADKTAKTRTTDLCKMTEMTVP